jgi:hypothetical protein
MIRITFGIVAALAIAAAFPAAPAQAQNGTLTRSFVSSAGVDSNPCTIAQPCATFARAYTAVAANGIVAALDPGKYGSLIITGPVTINGNGWAAITGLAQNNAITINAVSGNVTLIGLEIDGAGAGYNGIVFNSGSSLTVTNCTVQNFVGAADTGNGILIQPTSGAISFTITNTVVTNNGYLGIYYRPPSGSATAIGVIDHVVATNNQYGIDFITTFGGSTTTGAISNSVASDNSQAGIYINGGSGGLTVSIDSITATGNSIGILADAGTGGGSGNERVLLGRSVISANSSYGVVNNTNPNMFYSYGDNRIDENTENDVNGSMFPKAPK